MATYTVQEVTHDGITPTYTAVSASDTFTAPTDGTFVILHVKNAGGSSDTVVVDDPNTGSPAGTEVAFNPDLTISVTNGQERMIELDPSRFTNTSTGLITVTHSFTTSVTAGVFYSRR